MWQLDFTFGFCYRISQISYLLLQLMSPDGANMPIVVLHSIKLHERHRTHLQSSARSAICSFSLQYFDTIGWA